MHFTRDLILGRISARGVKLTYNSAATPICSLVLEVDKIGRDGKVYTGYHKVEIMAKFAEPCASELEPGDEIPVEGEHQYRSTMEAKTKEKKTTCVLSTWGVSQRMLAILAPVVELPNRGVKRVIGIEIIKGQVIVTLPKAVLVMTKQQFIEALRRGKAWRRRKALEQRQTTHGASRSIAACVRGALW